MSADKLDHGKFDEILERALKSYSESVPADFTDRMLRRIRKAEEQRILARVIMEERLTLAGCIVLGIMAIVAVVVFPGIAVSFKELLVTAERAVAGVGTSIDKVTQIIGAVLHRTPDGGYEWGSRFAGAQWQLYMVFAGVFGFAVCSLVDLLVSDS